MDMNLSTILYLALALYMILGLVVVTVFFLIGATLYGNGQERAERWAYTRAGEETVPAAESGGQADVRRETRIT